MRAPTLRFLLALAVVAGCSDTRGTFDGSVPPGLDGAIRGDAAAIDGAASGRDGSSPPSDGGPGSADGGSAGADAGPSGPELDFCVLGCAVQADCTTASPAFDANNYACEGGACRYTGCVDDAECQATFASGDYVCRDPGIGLRSCLEGCAADADCGAGTPAFDADNYTCDAGACRYLGCHTDGECESTFGADYGCIEAEPPPTPLPLPTATRNCVRRCTSVTDCATDSGAFDADNYECVSGACRYRGCNDDGECATSLSNSSYICR